MIKHFLLWIILFFGVRSVDAQQDHGDRSADLAFYADVMVNAQESFHRERAARMVDTLLENMLSVPSGMKDRLADAKWISTITPRDSSFRLITWSWKKNDGDFVYSGFIQLKNGAIKRLQPVQNEPSDPEYMEFRPERWYGQVYYNLHEYTSEGNPAYLLFGYRFTKQNRIVKTAEPITMNGNEIIFGKEIFFDDNRHGKNRLIISYSDNTTAALEYNEEMEKIVFDNIVSIINPYETGKVLMVPEGTYKAYKFRNGKWQYQDSILDTRYKEPPKEEKEKTEPKRDLFGR